MKLRFKRKKQIFSKLRDYKIYSDTGKLLGVIAHNESKVLFVDDEVKHVYLKIDWVKSVRVAVGEIEEGELIISSNLEDSYHYWGIVINVLSIILFYVFEYWLIALSIGFIAFFPYLYYLVLNKSALFKLEVRK